MRLWNMPLCSLSRLVKMQPEVHRPGNALHSAGKIEFGWSAVHRVDPQHQKQVDLAGMHIGRQAGETFDLREFRLVIHIQIRNRTAHCAERLIDSRREHMDFGRLGIARNHYGARTRRLHIADHRTKERILHDVPA